MDSKRWIGILICIFFVIGLAVMIVGMGLFDHIPEKINCLKGGAGWGMFRNGCADICGAEHMACTANIVEGCDCGPKKCWNGRSCTKSEPPTSKTLNPAILNGSTNLTTDAEVVYPSVHNVSSVFIRQQGNATNLQYCYQSSDCTLVPTNCCPTQECGLLALNKAFSDYWISTYNCTNATCPATMCMSETHADCIYNICQRKLGATHNDSEYDEFYRYYFGYYEEEKPHRAPRVIVGNITSINLINQSPPTSEYDWYVRLLGCPNCSITNLIYWREQVQLALDKVISSKTDEGTDDMTGNYYVGVYLTEEGMNQLVSRNAQLNMTEIDPYEINGLTAEFIRDDDPLLRQCATNEDCVLAKGGCCGAPPTAINRAFAATWPVFVDCSHGGCAAGVGVPHSMHSTYYRPVYQPYCSNHTCAYNSSPEEIK